MALGTLVAVGIAAVAIVLVTALALSAAGPLGLILSGASVLALGGLVSQV